jgi:hypothetical protein
MDTQQCKEARHLLQGGGGCSSCPPPLAPRAGLYLLPVLLDPAQTLRLLHATERPHRGISELGSGDSPCVSHRHLSGASPRASSPAVAHLVQLLVDGDVHDEPVLGCAFGLLSSLQIMIQRVQPSNRAVDTSRERKRNVNRLHPDHSTTVEGLQKAYRHQLRRLFCVPRSVHLQLCLARICTRDGTQRHHIPTRTPLARRGWVCKAGDGCVGTPCCSARSSFRIFTVCSRKRGRWGLQGEHESAGFMLLSPANETPRRISKEGTYIGGWTPLHIEPFALQSPDLMQEGQPVNSTRCSTLLARVQHVGALTQPASLLPIRISSKWSLCKHAYELLCTIGCTTARRRYLKKVSPTPCLYASSAQSGREKVIASRASTRADAMARSRV